MKKNLLFTLLGLIINQFAFAQSTEIRPGIILPQMTSAQRTTLSATNGMLVFDNDTQSYWLRSSGSWTELPKTAANTNFWQQTGLAGNEIKNTNSGGFWSANPTGLTTLSNDTSNPPTAPVSGAGTRLMWIPSRSAFRVGTVANNDTDGIYWWDANNLGMFSFASGYNALAQGWASTAMGYETKATTDFANAMGRETTASGNNSMAMGYKTTASGTASTAMGAQTIASGGGSTAMGGDTKAIGNYSTAMGNSTVASGPYSTAIGYNTEAISYYSTAMGSDTRASGNSSTAMGFNTIASGVATTAIGRFNFDNPNAIFMVGNGTIEANRVNLLTIRGDNNRVGIRTDNPIAPLHVSGFNYLTGGQANFFYTNAGLNSSSTVSANIGIYANEGIVSGTYVGAAQNVTASDTRIKNILNRSDNVADLELLKKIQITNYRMKDEGTWGTKTFKKVIAQEVEKVYPEAVSKQKSIIPDIYALAEKVVYDATKKELTVSMQKNYNLKVNENIELIHPERGKIRATIVAVSGNIFTVKDWLYETDKIFVFGREVDDFRVVDYEALSMLGISAIQELAKQNEALKKENVKQKAEISEIKKSFSERLEKIESILSKSNQ